MGDPSGCVGQVPYERRPACLYPAPDIGPWSASFRLLPQHPFHVLTFLNDLAFKALLRSGLSSWDDHSFDLMRPHSSPLSPTSGVVGERTWF
jgi:hypothetical protein